MAVSLVARTWLSLAKRVAASRRLSTQPYSPPTVELLYDAQAKLAGAPFYDVHTNELLWVDKFSRTLNFLNIDTRENRAVEMPETIGGAVTIAGSDRVAVLMGKRIVLVNRATGSTFKDMTTVDHLESPTTKLNAAKCDRLGRIWCGTIGPKYWSLDAASTMGALYCFAAVKGNLRRYLTGISIMNGIEWDENRNEVYVVDTIPKKVYSFEYDEVRCELSGQKIVIDYSMDSGLGYPHGICKDEKSNLWITGFMGGEVTCWDSTGGDMLHQFPIPSLRPTACCFGGPNYEYLFITTSRLNTPVDEMEKYPQTGGIFVARNLGVRGVPQHRMKVQPIRMSVGY